MSSFCREKLSIFVLSLWQVTQYWSSSARCSAAVCAGSELDTATETSTAMSILFIPSQAINDLQSAHAARRAADGVFHCGPRPPFYGPHSGSLLCLSLN